MFNPYLKKSLPYLTYLLQHIKIDLQCLYLFIAGIYKHGSVWISGDYRPEDMTENSQYLYAENEPNGSGKCFYLSASRYLIKPRHRELK